MSATKMKKYKNTLPKISEGELRETIVGQKKQLERMGLIIDEQNEELERAYAKIKAVL